MVYFMQTQKELFSLTQVTDEMINDETWSNRLINMYCGIGYSAKFEFVQRMVSLNNLKLAFRCRNTRYANIETNTLITDYLIGVIQDVMRNNFGISISKITACCIIDESGCPSASDCPYLY
jgi:hypothetical protein